MGRLKAYQQQVQQVLAKGIDKAEQGHKRLAERPFDLAEKLEKDVKSHSIKFVRAKHNDYAKNVYASLRTLNERANHYASGLISRLEKEQREASEGDLAASGQKPVAKKSAARKAASAKKSQASASASSSQDGVSV